MVTKLEKRIRRMITASKLAYRDAVDRGCDKIALIHYAQIKALEEALREKRSWTEWFKIF